MCLTPRVIQHLFYGIPLSNVSVQHTADQIDAVLADYEGDTEVSVHDLVNTIERVLLVDDGV
jgi:hypothetical protein